MTRLVSPSALIIRCIHQRGEDQMACLDELHRRGLWLSREQRAQADIPNTVETVPLQEVRPRRQFPTPENGSRTPENESMIGEHGNSGDARAD